MSNICKTVSLRTRKIKDGHMLSYYLDYYPGYRDESTMKVIRHESLGIYIYAKPKNQTEQKYNLNLMARAEAIRCRRFEAIVNERYDFFDKEKMKGDFLAYFKKLADKKNSKWQHVYMHFRTFTQGKCTFGEINVDLCNRFREYLDVYKRQRQLYPQDYAVIMKDIYPRLRHSDYTVSYTVRPLDVYKRQVVLSADTHEICCTSPR